MKKILLTAMVLAVVAMFASCTKEGVYNPSKKISRVYESSGSSKVLTELWHWDGKKLTSIDYYSSTGSISRTYNFTYDGKQLTRVDCYAYNFYLEFTYDGSKLKKFNTYYGGALDMSGDVTYDGSKVSQIAVTYNDKGIATKDPELMQMDARMLELVIPCFDKESYAKQLATKGVETSTYNFTWDGSNISQTVLTNGSHRATRKYTYDKKNNPYHGSLWAFYDEGINMWGSKNNTLTQVYTEQDNSGTDTRSYTYSYTYDGNWPTIQNISYSIDGSTYSYATYWEYDD